MGSTHYWIQHGKHFLFVVFNKGRCQTSPAREHLVSYHTANSTSENIPIYWWIFPTQPIWKASWEYWLPQKPRKTQVSEAVIYTSGMKIVFLRGHVQQLLPNSFLEQTNKLLFSWKSCLFTLSALKSASFRNFCEKFQNIKAKALPALLFPIRFHLPSFSLRAPFHPCIPILQFPPLRDLKKWHFNECCQQINKEKTQLIGKSEKGVNLSSWDIFLWLSI